MIPPGGEGKIKTTLKPKGNHTAINKRIVVHTNDPEQPQFALTLQGTLLVDAVASPANVFIRDLKVGKPGSATFAVDITEGSTAKITSVKVEDEENFSIKKVEADNDSDANYEVRFKGRDEVGASKTKVIIETSGENTPKLVIPVRASAELNLRYTKQVQFRRKDGKVQSRVLRISARHTDAPKIKKIVDPDGLLEWEVLDPQGPMANVRLKVLEDKLPADDGEKRHDLFVHTSDRDQPKLELKYRILPESKTGKPRPAKFRQAAK